VGPHRKLVLSVRNLHKSFGANDVLRGIAFDLAAGEALGVVGRSGSGKSTLLRSIDMLEAFDAGTIEYFGSIRVAVQYGRATVTSMSELDIERADAFRQIRRSIGLVFQTLNLWENRTVLDNMVLAPIVVLGEDAEKCRHEARELCGRFGLRDKLEARIWQLSGGQKQRVAIMRALMMKPGLLLLDEITSALDPMLVVDVMEAIRTLRQEGMSFILVTHHVEFACSVCDRLMFIEDGEVVQLGTPEEFKSESVDPRVKAFWQILRAAM
jgi:ABC-type polar amino acid transport system ATPase subunit